MRDEVRAWIYNGVEWRRTFYGGRTLADVESTMGHALKTSTAIGVWTNEGEPAGPMQVPTKAIVTAQYRVGEDR